MWKAITWISLVMSVLGMVLDSVGSPSGDDGGPAIASLVSVLLATGDAGSAPNDGPKPGR